MTLYDYEEDLTENQLEEVKQIREWLDREEHKVKVVGNGKRENIRFCTGNRYGFWN
jgi:hypothetical protein